MPESQQSMPAPAPSCTSLRPDSAPQSGRNGPGADSFRWATTADQPAGLFDIDELFDHDRSTGRMSDLQFLHVTAKRILNHIPSRSRAPSSWTINVYRGCSHACSFCFARPTHEYLGLNIGEDFDRKIVVKVNAVEKLRAELSHPRWAREPVAMGTNTDPYQRAEAKYRLTRGVLQALTESRTPFSILTKAPLVVRDLDILTEAASHLDVSVNFSLGTLDQHVWRATEPGAPNPRRRVDAMAKLSAAGIRTGALIAPVLPGLSDRADQLREVVAAIGDAGGRVLGIGPLHLRPGVDGRPGVREHFLAWLRGFDPDLHRDYLDRYATSANAPRRYLEQLYDRAGLTGPNRKR